MKFIYFELNENYNYIIEHLDVDLIVLNPLGLIFGSMYWLFEREHSELVWLKYSPSSGKLNTFLVFVLYNI